MKVESVEIARCNPSRCMKQVKWSITSFQIVNFDGDNKKHQSFMETATLEAIFALLFSRTDAVTSGPQRVIGVGQDSRKTPSV